MRYKNAHFNLDALLKEKGMSKTCLSYEARVTHTQINKMCSNKVTRIDLDTITRICSALECGVSDLIQFECEEQPGDNDTTQNGGKK